MSACRVLLVGGGVTSAAVACRLATLPVKVTCWDKARKPGGRMTTHVRGSCQVDLGPQYLTRNTQKGFLEPLFQELEDAGVVKACREDEEAVIRSSSDVTSPDEGCTLRCVDDVVWAEESGGAAPLILCKPINYIPTRGSQSLVEHLWARSGVTPCSSHFLDQLNSVDSVCWKATSRASSKTEEFEAVVFTLPVPQYIGLDSAVGRPLGNYLDKLELEAELYSRLQTVQFCSSFSLGVLYDRPLPLSVDWTHKYFPANPVIRYVAVDSLRRGCPEEPTSLCVQTQRSWAREHIGLSKEEAKSVILSELNSLIHNLPPPDHVIAHRWRYSQTETPFPESPGAVALLNSPLLVGAGDSFAQSNLEGCLYSAETAVNILKSSFNL